MSRLHAKRLAIMLFYVSYFHALRSHACDVTNENHYPIVLIHGLLGSDAKAMGYWGDLPRYLRDECKRCVLVAKLSAANSSEIRGQQLEKLLRDWQEHDDDIEAFHLVGHSQGGKDARVVLGMHPTLVESVTTINTPHRGSQVAKTLSETIDALPIGRDVVWRAGDVVACSIGVIDYFHGAICALQRRASDAVKQCCACDIKNVLREVYQNCDYQHVTNKIREVVKVVLLAAKPAICEAATCAKNCATHVLESWRIQDVRSAIIDLTPVESEKFNERFPLGVSDFVHEKPMFSISTYQVCPHGLLDFTGLFLQLLGYLFYGGEDNDGVVNLSSMHFGKSLGVRQGMHHMIAADNGMAKFRDDDVAWLKEKLRELCSAIK